MDKTRLTLGLMLGICGVLGGCSTESTVQRDANPVTGTTTGGDNTGLNGGMQGGTNGSPAPGSSTGGVGGADLEDDAGEPMVCPPGPTPGGSVLLIGDSYVAINNNNFGRELQRLAKAEGALAPSDAYKDRSISGTQMAGGIFPIPGQYDGENNADGHIKTVVMDGGGNDVLVGNRSCIDREAPPANQSCVNTINNATAAARKLFDKMAADGVENVVYFFYPHLPGGDLGGNKAIQNATLDYAAPLVKAACEEAPLPCVFVDTRGLFGDAVSDFQDGVHPTIENNNKIAAAVWAAMKRECIAQ